MNHILNEAIDRGWLAIALIRVCQAACHGTANGLHDQKDIELGGALWTTLEHAQKIMNQNQDFMMGVSEFFDEPTVDNVDIGEKSE